jgi:prevent-host-death family protein
MEPIQEYIPVTRAKAAFLDLIRQIERSDETIAITKNGVPEAVLMSVRKFRGLLETLELLSDEKAMKSIRRSIADAQKGTWVDLQEALGR